jgi:hypothetical protein
MDFEMKKFFIVLLASTLLAGSVLGANVRYEVESPDEPFSYYYQPTFGVGVPDSAQVFTINTDYAYTYVYSPKSQEVTFSAGSDGPMTTWVNGKLAFKNPAYRGWRGILPDKDRFPVTLKKGWNSLLIKSCSGSPTWGFCFRILDDNGNYVKGIKFSADSST